MNEQQTGQVLMALASTLEARREASPSSSYVAKLYSGGDDAILKKIGEESTEVILAAKGSDSDHLVRETADLWFHCLVLLAHKGLGPQQVISELASRFGVSGLEEKAARNNKEG